MALPIGYLLISAAHNDPSQLAADLFRYRTMTLLLRTVALAGGVLVMVTALGFPIAWLTTKTDLPAAKWFALIGVLPLAVPGYISAYALRGVGGYGGPWHRVFDQIIASPKGYWGAVFALGMYNLPYMFLNLRTGMSDLDSSIEEAGSSLGHGRLHVFLRLTLPQLLPAWLAGAMLVCLHVIGDFGVVSLMQYETFSLALYTAFSTEDAAAPALVLIAMAAAILLADVWLLRGLVLHRTSAIARGHHRPSRLGSWWLPAAAYLIAVAMFSVAIPVSMVIFWAFQNPILPITPEVLQAALCSLMYSLPAAISATALAIPIALLGRRHPSIRSTILERIAFAGHGVPALAFALSLIWATRLVPPLYHGFALSFTLLVGAYTVHFLAEAVGPIRSGLYLATPRLEEAARGLGLGWLATTWRVTLPLLRPGLMVSSAMVFLSVMKELPLTMLLAPIPYNQTLAVKVWSLSEDAFFAEAAPFALCILVTSAVFVRVLTTGNRVRT